MKIQINGFDIEINTNEAEMSVKVLDASGKELANNTYTQTLEGTPEPGVEDPGMETADDVNADATEPGAEETEDTGLEPGTEEEDSTLEDETENESLEFPTFEQFKNRK